MKNLPGCCARIFGDGTGYTTPLHIAVKKTYRFNRVLSPDLLGGRHLPSSKGLVPQPDDIRFFLNWGVLHTHIAKPPAFLAGFFSEQSSSQVREGLATTFLPFVNSDCRNQKTIFPTDSARRWSEDGLLGVTATGL
jgi:hypothetical protein